MVRDHAPHRAFAPAAVMTAFILSALACSGNPFQAPTPTPTATVTITATTSASPTPTVTGTPTKIPTPDSSYLDWPVVLSDSFDDNRNHWVVGDFENDHVKAKFSVAGGKYVFDMMPKGEFTLWNTQDVPPEDALILKDFFLSVDVEKTEGPSDVHYGLMFCYEGTDQYIFPINPEQQDSHFLAYFDEEWIEIIGKIKSPQIRANGSNRIAVLAENSDFSFFINGEIVARIKDDTMDEGRIGVGLFGYTAGERIVIEFDNLEVRAPKSQG